MVDRGRGRRWQRVPGLDDPAVGVESVRQQGRDGDRRKEHKQTGQKHLSPHAPAP